MKKYVIAAIAGSMIFALSSTALALNTPVTISGWTGSFWQSPDNDNTLTPGATGIKITTNPEIVQEGKGALHIFVEKTADNLNAQAVQSLAGMEAGKSYRISGLFNAPSTSSRYRIALGSKTLVVLGEMVEPLSWGRLEYVFQYDGSSTEFKIIASGGGDIYVDDLSVREVIYEEDGVTVSGYGDELLRNGDFESDLDFIPPDEIQEYSVVNMDTKAEISWTNPFDNDFKFVRLYDITDGEMRYIGETSGERYIVTGLENNKTHRILIQTVDEWDNVSDGTVVEVNPIPDAVKFSETLFEIDGEAVTEIGPGLLSAGLSVKNNAMAEDYSVELILVLLKDGAVVDIASDYCIIPQRDFRDPYTDISVELPVPDGEGYSAELYVWDSLSGMDALTDVAAIE